MAECTSSSLAWFALLLRAFKERLQSSGLLFCSLGAMTFVGSEFNLRRGSLWQPSVLLRAVWTCSLVHGGYCVVLSTGERTCVPQVLQWSRGPWCPEFCGITSLVLRLWGPREWLLLQKHWINRVEETAINWLAGSSFIYLWTSSERPTMFSTYSCEEWAGPGVLRPSGNYVSCVAKGPSGLFT